MPLLAGALGLLSQEHFTVDGTLIEAWGDGEAVGGEGGAKRETALELIEPWASGSRVTLGRDRGYDTRGFVEELRKRGVPPHVVQNTTSR